MHQETQKQVLKEAISLSNTINDKLIILAYALKELNSDNLDESVNAIIEAVQLIKKSMEFVIDE